MEFLAQIQPLLTFLVSSVASLAVAYLSVRQFNLKRIKAQDDQERSDDESRTHFRDEIRKENKDMREELSRVRSQLAEVMDQHMKCKVETAELKIDLMILKAKMGEAVIVPQKP